MNIPAFEQAVDRIAARWSDLHDALASLVDDLPAEPDALAIVLANPATAARTRRLLELLAGQMVALAPFLDAVRASPREHLKHAAAINTRAREALDLLEAAEAIGRERCEQGRRPVLRVVDAGEAVVDDTEAGAHDNSGRASAVTPARP